MSKFQNHSDDSSRTILSFNEINENLKRVIHIKRIQTPDSTYGFQSEKDTMLCDFKALGKDFGIVQNINQLETILFNNCEMVLKDANGDVKYIFCEDCVRLAQLALMVK